MHFTQQQLEDPFLESTFWGDDADPDSDRHSNLFEYIAGLDPNDDSSIFTTLVSRSASPNSVDISFSPRLEGRTYNIYYRTEIDGSDFLPADGTASDDGNTRPVTDSTSEDSMRFYRVEVSLP